jgi:hypothetical protein
MRNINRATTASNVNDAARVTEVMLVTVEVVTVEIIDLPHKYDNKIAQRTDLVKH